jgi:Zn-dependent metalloprotease
VYENLGVIHKFLREVFDRELMEDAGGSLTASIHYGSNYDNSFWNGQQVVLGDGDGQSFRKGAFTTLSMVASEISHAVTGKMAGLLYVGQPGALNTSFSDVFSTLVEQWQKKQTADEASWLMMEGAFAQGGNGSALRSLKQPGTAYKDVPNIGSDRQVATMDKIYTGSQDNGGVHLNSGIPNKAFYEVAKRLKGYAWGKPAKIWWEALGNLKPKSTFEDFAKATIAASDKLYGAQEHEAVVQGWMAVGILIKSPT